MRKKSFKVVFALTIVALLFVLVALAVSAEGEQITIKYYQGSVDYYDINYEDYYNPDKNLKLTETYTAGDTVTVRADKYSRDEDGRTFYGWFSEDGTFYEAGGSYVFTKDTKLYEAYGTTVTTFADLKTYLNKGWYVKLGADIETTTAFGELNWGKCCVIDMNGHNITATVPGSLFVAPATGIMITGNGTITHTASSTDKTAVYEAKRRGYGDAIQARLWVGKGVTINTNANLIYVNNSMDENDTACCPRVKIYGNVTANRLMYASNALRRSNFEIFEGSNVTLNSTELFKSDYSSTSIQVNVFIYGGNFTLQANSVFYDTIDKFGYCITGGTFNYEVPSELLKNGYECNLNEESGKYEIEFDGCTHYADGVHVFEPTTAIDGKVVTCTEDGYYVYECACGKSYNGVLTALGHSYGDPVVDKEYTLTECGLTSWHCIRCDDTITRKTYPQISEIYFTVTLEIDSEVKTIRVKATDFINYSKGSDVTLTTDYVLTMGTIKSTFKDADDESVTYSMSNITGVKIPLGITVVANDGIKKVSTLETIDFSATYGLTVNADSFGGCTKLTNIIFGDNMTILGAAFKNCTALTTIVVGDGLTVNFKGERIFNGCKITSAVFGASDITFGRFSFSFKNFNTSSYVNEYTSLTSVKFSKGGKYTFGEKAFGYSSITEVVFPDGAVVIPAANDTDAFWRCNYIKYVYLGEGSASAAKLFNDCSGLQKVVLVGPTLIGNGGFLVGSGNSVVTGENVVLKVYIHKTDCTISDNAFEGRSGVQVYTMTKIENAKVFNKCVATDDYPAYTIYYGIPHEYTAHKFEPTCVKEGYDGYITDCPHCGAGSEPEYPTTYKVFEGVLTNSATFEEVTLAKTNIVATSSHTAGDVVRITYAKGFDNIGVHVRTCSVCKDNYETEDAEAIFKALGYSIKDTSAESTGNAIYGGFTVSKAALDEYNKYTTTPLKYGIIISNVTGDDVNNISFTGNIINGKSIQVEIKNSDFARFGFTLTSFDDAKAKALNIVISAYVIDENGNMSFVQRTESYSKTVTVNSVVASTLGAVTFADVEAWTKATVSE